MAAKAATALMYAVASTVDNTNSLVSLNTSDQFSLENKRSSFIAFYVFVLVIMNIFVM